MTTIKLKIKINNSYESEPSSGSGSSCISEANEYEHIDRKSRNHCIKLNRNLYSMPIINSSLDKIEHSPNSPHSPSDISYYDIKESASQESDFEGFTDYQIKVRTFSPNRVKIKSFSEGVKPTKHSPKATISHNRALSSYHEIMVDQNSCNAVDLQLANGRNYFGASEVEHNSPEKLATELTFNGKISSLTTCGDTDFKQPKAVGGEMADVSYSFRCSNERSPDLFGDDDEDDDERVDNEEEKPADKSLNCPTESSFAEENLDNTADENANYLRQNIKKEKEILKRIKSCLAGIPPPPSFTIPQIDLFSAIANNKDEILNYKTDIETVASVIVCEEESLFKPSHPLDEVWDMSFKETLGVRGHGFCYNLCKASESIELLSLAVVERYIGAETSTSYTANCTTSPSSAKKRNLRQKMLTQTTGNNRLSHLAKRRAAFSSANLSTALLKPQSCALGGMQILLDKKKGKSRRKGTTPKRMTPSSKKKNTRKTPSSSARKRLFRYDIAKPGPSRETSKRALFQSPAKQQRTLPVIAALKPQLKPEIANRVEKSKRALFSPEKPSQSSKSSQNYLQGFGSQRSQSIFNGENLEISNLKRKRTDDDGSSNTQQSKKIFRHETEELTPRSLKIKSQSFCVGTSSTNVLSSSTTTLSRMQSNTSLNSSIASTSRSSTGRPITKAFSDTTFNSSSLLTENHRKKLLWAVSQALQSKQINVTHASFKQFASVLARVVKRLFQEYYMKMNTSTSDTMLRLAKKHVCSVVAGKNADDIYILARSKIEDERKLSSTRLSGYIAPEEFENRKLSLTQNSFCSFENTMMDSIALSQSSIISQPTDVLTESKSAIKLAIQPNPNLQKSSSKNNLDGMALRENVDCEQRWSAQKQLFTGVEKQNVSPYANSSQHRTSLSSSSSFRGSLFDLNSSTVKAKRQISFDSL